MAIAASALLVTAIGGDHLGQDETEPVQVCELAYYTGSFAAYGPTLTNDVRFAVEDVVNRTRRSAGRGQLISEDIGDSFEGARRQEVHRATRCRDPGEHRSPVPDLP